VEATAQEKMTAHNPTGEADSMGIAKPAMAAAAVCAVVFVGFSMNNDSKVKKQGRQDFANA
jgi:hypothetical protein